jgi:hypothetical protein
MDSRNATTEWRKMGASGWVAFNPILEEVPAVERNVLIGSGDKFAVKFDANGPFIPGQADPGRECSVVFREADGCEFRSERLSSRSIAKCGTSRQRNKVDQGPSVV